MATVDAAPPARPALSPAVLAILAGALLALSTVDLGVGAIAVLGTFAAVAYLRGAVWLAAGAGAWVLVFVAVLVLPGPYDSWAGRAAVPVLAAFALCFLTGWALGRHFGAWPGEPVYGKPEVRWPPERRLLAYLGALLAIGVATAAIRYRGAGPPLFAANPDAARDALRAHDNIYLGLAAEAWTLGMATSLMRALTGRSLRWSYGALALVFTFGAALGASKNSVLVGIVPGVVAALSVRRQATKARHARPRRGYRRTIVLVGLAAVAAAVFLGGQRTLAGTGLFEDEFRARYGGNPVTATVGALDLSLSSSAETFGRLWYQRDGLGLRYGSYTMQFLGSPGERLFGRTDLYGITAQLSSPYYMNTATFVAIPLLDYGAVGAAAFLMLLGIGVGLAERRLEYRGSAGEQLGRALIVYFAAFGVYELYPAIYPTWLALIPGLWLLVRLGRAP